ncbi:molecular chaperone DnaJ [Candidatus Pelagibacter sp.]|nr:molecular chaperone DnaJ [Candidatus Pelagibacter sp.]
MNIFFLTLIVFLIIYFFLNWFVNSKSKKIKNFFRKTLIFGSIALAIFATFAGRYLFSLPFLLAILPLIKTKAGITLFQVLRLWSLIKVLKNSGRFNFSNSNAAKNLQSMSKDEACEILNLDPKKKYNDDQILNSYKKIMKKIHPDKNPELNRLAVIVNQAKDTLIKSPN